MKVSMKDEKKRSKVLQIAVVSQDHTSFEDSMAVSAVLFRKTCSIERSVGSKGLELMKAAGNQIMRATKEAKCELVDYDSLPDYLKDNEFILGWYRCEWPLKETILSIFSIHNETINVWTHLIGFLIFLSLTAFTAMVMPRDVTVPSMQYSSGQLTETNTSAGSLGSLLASLLRFQQMN